MSLGHTMLETVSQIQYMTGLGSSDGTSNNALKNLVRRVRDAVIVLTVGVFIVRALMIFATKSGGADGTAGDQKALIGLTAQFAVAMALIFGAWWIADLAANISRGAFGN
jgi:hypothetical protein